MTFDGITTRAVVFELKEKLLDGRVNKINQPSDHTITISIYSKGENRLLYISSEPSQSCFYLTNRKFQNPMTPPNFCMLLRKHIGKAKISRVDQIGLDRTVSLRFDTFNELGDPIYFDLVSEFMGKYSNIILVNMNGRIVDSIKRVSHDMSRVRQIYPGLNYEIFTSDKKDILKENLSISELKEDLSDQAQINKIFVKNLTGFSPIISRELAFRAGLDPDLTLANLTDVENKKLQKVFEDLVTSIRLGKFSPSLYKKNKKQFHAFNIFHLGEADLENKSISNIMDHFFEITVNDDRLGSKKTSLLSILEKHINKEDKKLQKLRSDYDDSLDMNVYKEEADLLSSKVHLVNRGMKEITLDDFFNDNKERTIILDPKKDGWENVQHLYKIFSKKKKSNSLLTKRIPELENYIEYLKQLHLTLEKCDSLTSLAEIKEEMENEKLIKKKKNKAKKISNTRDKSQAMKFISKDGLEILVGNNNQQNDRLTLKIANKDDYFFHAKGIPGAHVILRTSNKLPTELDIEAAAYLAAKYSSESSEDRVDVDYTLKKNVYKAKGAKPGMVYYNDFSTITVNMAAEIELNKKD